MEASKFPFEENRQHRRKKKKEESAVKMLDERNDKSN